jgi:hypothetical protein
MAKVSDGYTLGSVAQCIRDVITCKRMLQLRVKPLTHVELINALRLVRQIKAEKAFLAYSFGFAFCISRTAEAKKLPNELLIFCCVFSRPKPFFPPPQRQRASLSRRGGSVSLMVRTPSAFNIGFDFINPTLVLFAGGRRHLSVD